MIIIATIKGCLADHMKHTESRSEIPNPHGRCLDFTNQTSYAFCVDFCIPVLEKMSLDLSNCKDLAIEQYKDMCRARMERGDREEFDEDIAAGQSHNHPPAKVMDIAWKFTQERGLGAFCNRFEGYLS